MVPNTPFIPEPPVLEIIAERLELYRAVANVALKIPFPVGTRKQLTGVSNQTLLDLREALNRLIDHSEDLEVML